MRNKRFVFIRTLAICCLALSLLVISACAQQKNDSSQTQGTETTALIVYAQDGDYLFVDMETETLFFPNLVDATITNSSGSKISIENLAVGDIVTIVGDGAMTMSYPALYPNISSVKIDSRGNMDDVESYTETIIMLFSPANEGGVPSGWLNYDTSVGNITLALDAYSSQGFADDNAKVDEQNLSGSYANESGVINEQIPDARFKDTIDATIGFPDDFQSTTVERIPLAQSANDRLRVDLVTPRESVQVTVVGNGELTLSIEPGYIYVVNVKFANGEAHYAFTTLDY